MFWLLEARYPFKDFKTIETQIKQDIVNGVLFTPTLLEERSFGFESPYLFKITIVPALIARELNAKIPTPKDIFLSEDETLSVSV